MLYILIFLKRIYLASFTLDLKKKIIELVVKTYYYILLLE